MDDLTRQQRWNRFKAWLSAHTPIPSRWLGCEPVILNDNAFSLICYMADYNEKYGCDPMSGRSMRWYEGWAGGGNDDRA